MANGYFERGEMYDILFGDSLAGEMAAHRPGVIVSSEEGNRTSPTVLMVYTTTTTTNKRISVNHKFQMNGWDNYALCSQIVTVNKNRLKKFYGKLSDGDMRAIDGCLEEALDLGYIDDTAVKEKETEIAVLNIQIKELREEVAKLKSEIANHEDADTARKVEIAMWQRLYEKALDQVCSMKLNGDIIRREEKKAPTTVKVEVEETPKIPEPPVEDKPKLVDINTAKFDELKKCGMSNNIVMSVISRRPYTSVEDLKKVPGFTSTMYGIMSKKLCCVVPSKKTVSALAEPDTGFEEEPKPSGANGKVNVNTATAQEIAQITGMAVANAYGITSYRKKIGVYRCLEDLLKAPRYTEGMLKKHRGKMEV